MILASGLKRPLFTAGLDIKEVVAKRGTLSYSRLGTLSPKTTCGMGVV